MADKPQRRTPIERYIEDGRLDDRRARWEEKQREAGYTRVTVRVHADDVEALRGFAAALNEQRKPKSD